jgi:hypothetical protein
MKRRTTKRWRISLQAWSRNLERVRVEVRRLEFRRVELSALLIVLLSFPFSTYSKYRGYRLGDALCFRYQNNLLRWIRSLRVGRHI